MAAILPMRREVGPGGYSAGLGMDATASPYPSTRAPRLNPTASPQMQGSELPGASPVDMSSRNAQASPAAQQGRSLLTGHEARMHEVRSSPISETRSLAAEEAADFRLKFEEFMPRTRSSRPPIAWAECNLG